MLVVKYTNSGREETARFDPPLGFPTEEVKRMSNYEAISLVFAGLLVIIAIIKLSK